MIKCVSKCLNCKLIFLQNILQTRRKPPAKKRKAGDLDDLKQELDIDFHKVTPEELYQRFQTHPENVRPDKNFKKWMLSNI